MKNRIIRFFEYCFPKAKEEHVNTPSIGKSLEIRDETLLGNTVVDNARARVVSVGLEPSSKEAVDYISREKKEVDLGSKSLLDVKFKNKNRRKVLVYNLTNKEGEVLYSGKKFRKFMTASGTELPFNYKQAYRFCNNKKNKVKLFFKEYYISSSEFVKKVN
jgi:hypothetical protein